MTKKRFRAAAMLFVFTVSAVVHEYILAVCFGFFYPVLFCLFMCFGSKWKVPLHNLEVVPNYLIQISLLQETVFEFLRFVWDAAMFYQSNWLIQFVLLFQLKKYKITNVEFVHPHLYFSSQWCLTSYCTTKERDRSGTSSCGRRCSWVRESSYVFTPTSGTPSATAPRKR